MDRRKIVVRVLTILGGTVGAALLIFVLLPWLTSPEPVEEIVEQGLASASFVETEVETSDEGVEGEGALPVSVPLLPEDLALGASVASLQTKAEESGMAAPTGELPDLLSPAEVAAVMSEPVRMASAPDVEMDDGQGSANEPSAKAETVPVQDSVAVQPTPGETGEVAQPVVVEAVAPQVLEASQQVAEEPEALETVEVQESSGSGVPRVEFEMPPGRGFLEGPGIPVPAVETAAVVHDAGQAGPLHPGLPPQTAIEQPEPVLVPGTLRGVMGYRLPLVSRQELPDQVVSGVLIPAHTTYVILQPGHWELVGLSPDEVGFLRDAAAKAKAEELAARCEAEPEAVCRGWNPFRPFRKR